MPNELLDNFLQKHQEWNDLLTKIDMEKTNCKNLGEIQKVSLWERLESITYKTIDDEMIDYADAEQDERDDIATE